MKHLEQESSTILLRTSARISRLKEDLKSDLDHPERTFIPFYIRKSYGKGIGSKNFIFPFLLPNHQQSSLIKIYFSLDIGLSLIPEGTLPFFSSLAFQVQLALYVGARKHLTWEEKSQVARLILRTHETQHIQKMMFWNHLSMFSPNVLFLPFLEQDGYIFMLLSHKTLMKHSKIKTMYIITKHPTINKNIFKKQWMIFIDCNHWWQLMSLIWHQHNYDKF